MAYQLNAKGSSGFSAAFAKTAVLETNGYVWVAYLESSSARVACCVRTGATLSSVAQVNLLNNSQINILATDGTYVYAGDNSGRLYALSCSGGTITVHNAGTQLDGTAGQIYTMFCDNQGVIHYAGNIGYIKAATFDGVDFTHRNRIATSASVSYQLGFDGLNIVSADGNSLRNVRYANGAYTALGVYTVSNEYFTVIVNDGTRWYAATSTPTLFLRALSLSADGNTWTLLGSVGFPGGVNYCRSLRTDGAFLYAFYESYGVVVYSYDAQGNTFANVSYYSDTGIAGYDGGSSFRSPYFSFCSGSNLIRWASLDLSAAFTSNKTTGLAPLAVTFTAT